MTEKTTYVCDICGKEFEDEESCLAHEKEEKHKEFENRIALFDNDGHWVKDDITFAFTVWVADEEALDYVNELLNESGYCDIPFDFDEEEVLNIFYIDDNENWRCLSDDVNKLLNLQENVEKTLDNYPEM